MNLAKYLNDFRPKELKAAFTMRDFSKALSMIIGMVLPIVIGVNLGNLTMGIFVTLGVVFTSFNDSAGSLRLKITSMFLSIILTVSITFIMHFLKVPLYLFIPVLGIMIFVISYISIYGFRASLISFSGLFSIVLSMSSVSDSDLSIYTRLILIALGGLWYILLVLVREILFPKNTTEYFIEEALNLTADYMEIRAKLIDYNDVDRRELVKDLLDKQQALTENHETLRELLLSRRLVSGRSSYQVRRSQVFRLLVDMLELAMANPVNYGKTDSIFKNNPGKMEDFQELMRAMAERLRYLSKYSSNPAKIKSDQRIQIAINQIKKDIQQLIENPLKLTTEQDVIALRNYWRYQKNQFGKIIQIEDLICNKNKLDVKRAKKEDKSHFLTKQDYNISVLKVNFNIKSGIFRHSLRIAVVGMVGYGLGMVLELVNSYWILLTIIIIMRPNYGLTKERFANRSIGTIMGGILAFIVIYFVHSTTVYGILAILCYTVGLSMVQKNYKAAAAFITMYVLFIYALLNPEVFKYIQFRILDTLIGAGLAYLGSWLLWPFWEIKSIDNTLKTAIEAYREYLEEIGKLYNDKGEVTTAYKLSRKSAFLALSDLSSSFQRMMQEPRTQHKSLNEVFQIVMLMHSFLASLASLGTFIVNNKTTEASKDFNLAVEGIKGNLLLSEEALNKWSVLNSQKDWTTHYFDEEYEKRLEAIAAKGKLDEDLEASSLKDEAHLLSEQFKWLMFNSHRMARILRTIHFEKP